MSFPGTFTGVYSKITNFASLNPAPWFGIRYYTRQIVYVIIIVNCYVLVTKAYSKSVLGLRIDTSSHNAAKLIHFTIMDRLPAPITLSTSSWCACHEHMHIQWILTRQKQQCSQSQKLQPLSQGLLTFCGQIINSILNVLVGWRARFGWDLPPCKQRE